MIKISRKQLLELAEELNAINIASNLLSFQNALEHQRKGQLSKNDVYFCKITNVAKSEGKNNCSGMISRIEVGDYRDNSDFISHVYFVYF